MKERRTWFPYERIEFQSPLGMDEVQGRLDAIINPDWLQGLQFGSHCGTPFAGELRNRSFKVLLSTPRFCWWSALVATGRITPRGTGTHVETTLRPHTGTLVFVAAFLLFALWKAAQWMLVGPPPGVRTASVWHDAVFPVLYVVAFCCLTIVLVRYHRRRAVRLLRAALDCPWVGPA